MQYEIFRDVLVIVISVTGVLGVLIGGLIFFLLRIALMKDISTAVNKQLDEECRRLRAQSDVQLGVVHWIQGSYDNAIDVTKRALAKGGDVLDETDTIFAKSNLGFYYAEKHRKQPSWGLKEIAIDLTKIGYEKYSLSLPELRKPDWIDNYVFVKATFARTDDEKEEVAQLIDKLLLRGDLEAIYTYLKESRQYVKP